MKEIVILNQFKKNKQKDKPNNMSLAEITEKLAKIEKDIEREKELLGEAKNAHFQDGDVWLTYKLQFRPIDKIEDIKTKRTVFSKKQIEQVRKGLETISELRKVRNELLLEKVKRQLTTELYTGIGDFGDNSKSYLSYDIRIEDIKEYGNSLVDEQKYKYYVRLETELSRMINAFRHTEFLRFDGNMYFGLVEFIDSVEYIIDKEQCPELERIVRENIKNLDIYAGEKDLKRAIAMIEADLLLLPERLAKTKELLDYEINYLQKIIAMETMKAPNETQIEKKKESNLQLYKNNWQEFVNEHFKSEIFITQLDPLDDEEEDGYIKFCVKHFKRRTIPEWMKYYERLDKASQYETLKGAKLPPEIEYVNTLRITDAKFEESTLGQYTLGNLKMFESKYILQNYEETLPKIIKIYRSVVKQYILQRKAIRGEIKNSENEKDEFEKKFAKKMEARFSLLVNSGSSANLLALSTLTSRMLGERAIQPGDEVITVAAGFPTTLNPIIQNGAIPVFVDVDLPTYNIDVSKLEEAKSNKTKAVMIAHTLGNPFDLKTVKDFCDANQLYLIEDCCDAMGARFGDKRVGSFGVLGTASFYPAHHITMGEGGAVFVSGAG